MRRRRECHARFCAFVVEPPLRRRWACYTPLRRRRECHAPLRRRREYAQTAADHAQAAAARALTYSTSAATALVDVNRATTAAQLAQANCLASHTATVDAAETCQTSLAEVRRLLYATQACVDTNRPRAAVPAVAPIRRRTYKRPAANPWSRIAKRPATAENVDSM